MMLVRLLVKIYHAKVVDLKITDVADRKSVLIFCKNAEKLLIELRDLSFGEQQTDDLFGLYIEDIRKNNPSLSEWIVDETYFYECVPCLSQDMNKRDDLLDPIIEEMIIFIAELNRWIVDDELFYERVSRLSRNDMNVCCAEYNEETASVRVFAKERHFTQLERLALNDGRTQCFISKCFMVSTEDTRDTPECLVDNV